MKKFFVKAEENASIERLSSVRYPRGVNLQSIQAYVLTLVYWSSCHCPVPEIEMVGRSINFINLPKIGIATLVNIISIGSKTKNLPYKFIPLFVLSKIIQREIPNEW